MEAILNFEYIALVPPILTLILVLTTRRVLLSLGVGIVTSAIVIANGNLLESLALVWSYFVGIFVDDGWINSWEAFILIFLALLGIMSSFISMSGGARAFTEWAISKVSTRRGAKLLTGVLGIIIFIDDYFSALMVGQVSRPLTDKYQVSRAKLAYLVDTTASPVSVIAPVSSWGAGIMGLTAPLLVLASLDITAFQAFVMMIPLNLYVVTALILMFIVIILNFNIGPMRAHEERAMESGILFNDEKVVPGEASEDLPVSTNSSPFALVIPLVALAITVILSMYITGVNEGGSWSVMSALENTLVTHSLLIGGTVGLILSLIYFFKTDRDGNDEKKNIWLGVKSGFLAMLPAMMILTLAWIIGGLIGELGTGQLLGEMVQNSNIAVQLLPALVFIVACIMSLATGTSWGSFGILIPIAGQIIISLDQPDLLLITIAAVLAGSVFGDHCSPISDSTILASTGSGSNHIDHVTTQIPYAITSALIALVGFLVLGYTTSTLLGLGTVLVLLAGVVVVARVSGQAVAENTN